MDPDKTQAHTQKTQQTKQNTNTQQKQKTLQATHQEEHKPTIQQNKNEEQKNKQKNQRKELSIEEKNQKDKDEGTMTKAELTLTQTRDPIHPDKTKQQQQKADDKNKADINIKIITEAVDEQQRKISISDTSCIALERPQSINIGKDSIQMKTQSQIDFKEPEAKIQVKETIQKGFALNKQVFYRVTGFDKHGSIDIPRKISQFESLRKILLQRWPGCFVPTISQKSQVRTQQLRNIHKRRNIEMFLRKLSYCEQIYYKQQIQLFLRSYGIQIEQMFTQMPVLRVKDVIQRFKACFGERVEKPSIPQYASIISRFSTSLKKIANNLSNLSKKALKLAESYQSYQLALPKFSKVLNSYQQNCLSQYTNDPDCSIALKDKQGRLDRLNIMSEKNNIFYELYFMIQSEQRDAQALSDIILAMEMFMIKRDELETESKETRLEIDQISLGHKNIKMMTSRKTKEEVQAQLQQKQKNLIGEKHTIMELSSIAQIVLATITIPMFKKIKVNTYFGIIKRWMDLVGETNTQIHQVWKYLGEQSKIQYKKCTKS